MVSALAAVLAGSLLLTLPFLGGDPFLRQELGLCLMLTLFGAVQLLWATYRPKQYDGRRLLVAGVLWLLGVLAALRYFGVFSPVVALLPLGVFFFGMTRDAQTPAFLAASGSYLALAVSSLHDGKSTSILGQVLSPAQATTLLLLTELVIVVAYLGARSVHAATLLGIARHERAAWAVVQRDAVVAELQKDLARALDVAGVGRFSDTTVGQYHLGEVIGRGAMGEVYAARHEKTQVEAAVKLLHAHTLREPGSVQRFLREANMAAALETPHAVRILEVGGFGGELPYLAMERLRGEDLAEHLRKRSTMSFSDLSRLLVDVGAGLDAARKAGVIHRDLKPRNLFLAEQPDGTEVWKLLDFGVSRFATADVTHADGRIIGTPEYMAPEQAAGEAVTHQTDLFSLGAVVYRALTGNPAFAGDHLAEVLYKVAHTMPPRPSALADLAPEVDMVLAVALAKAPADRFASAEELREAIEGATRGKVQPDLRARSERILLAMPWSEAPEVGKQND